MTQIQEIETLMVGLTVGETSQHVLDKANELGLFLQSRPQFIEFALQQLAEMASAKKDGLRRESGILGFVGVVGGLGAASYPFVEKHVPLLLTSLADKGSPVREAAYLALDSIFNLTDDFSLFCTMQCSTNGNIK
jgi:hypothetical protein